MKNKKMVLLFILCLFGLMFSSLSNAVQEECVCDGGIKQIELQVDFEYSGGSVNVEARAAKKDKLDTGSVPNELYGVDTETYTGGTFTSSTYSNAVAITDIVTEDGFARVTFVADMDQITERTKLDADTDYRVTFGGVSKEVRIHTSCSRDIGPPFVFGDFELISFIDINNNVCEQCEDTDDDYVCDEEDNCPYVYNPRETIRKCKCVNNKVDGLQYGINSITYEYTGSGTPVTVKIYDASSVDPSKLIATKSVSGGKFTISGPSSEIGHADTTIELKDATGATIGVWKHHTSCSRYIYPGQVVEIQSGSGTLVVDSWDPVEEKDCIEESGEQLPCEDLGDAPDPTYPTLLASNGARHIITNLYLGASVDPEADGQPNPTATGDDIAGVPDDEDGVIFNTPLLRCQSPQPPVQTSITVIASAPGLLDAWVDFNGNGVFDHPAEQIFANQPLVPGPNALTFPVPCTAALGNTFARFRLSTAGGLTPTGPAPDGEVEDYYVEIIDPCGDNLPPTVTIDGIEGHVGEIIYIDYTTDDPDDSSLDVCLYYSLDGVTTYEIECIDDQSIGSHTYEWDTTGGLPTGGAVTSADIAVAEGEDTPVVIVKAEDGCNAKVEANIKFDPTPIPEFSTIGTVLVIILVAVGGYVVTRKKK